MTLSAPENTAATVRVDRVVRPYNVLSHRLRPYTPLNSTFGTNGRTISAQRSSCAFSGA